MSAEASSTLPVTRPLAGGFGPALRDQLVHFRDPLAAVPGERRLDLAEDLPAGNQPQGIFVFFEHEQIAGDEPEPFARFRGDGDPAVLAEFGVDELGHAL